MVDLEWVRIHEIRDKRVDWVVVVESAMADLIAWRPSLNGQLDDIRLEMKRFNSWGDQVLMDPCLPRLGLLPHLKSVVTRPSARAPTDWPSEHYEASTT